MKKFSTFKLFLFILCIVFLCTFLIPTGEFKNGEFLLHDKNAIGLFDFGSKLINSFAYLIPYALMILIVGGFYGILSKTGAYGYLIEKVVNKFKNKEIKFILFLIISLILLSSFVGLTYIFILIVPILITILFKMGFNKITIFASTFGSILIGNMCAIYSNSINHYIIKYLYLNSNDHIVFRIIFLLLIIFFFSAYIINRINKDKELLKKELYININIKRKIIPLIIIVSFFIILLVLGMLKWSEFYHINYFNELHENINSYEFIPYIFGNINPLGYFDITSFIIIVVIMSIIIGWIYSLSFSTFIDSFKDGMRRFLLPAFYASLAGVIAIIIGNSNTIFMTISNFLLTLFKGAEIVMMPIVSFIGGIFYNDYDKFISSIALISENIIPDTTKYPVVAFISECFYGLSKFMLPTSMILVVGLSMLDIPISKWLKYIFKFIIIFIIISTIFILLINKFY